MDTDAFEGVGVAGDDGDAGGGDVEGASEEGFDGFVGLAVFGGFGDFDFEGVAEESDEGVAAGVGDDFGGDDEAVGGGFDAEGHGGGPYKTRHAKQDTLKRELQTRHAKA